MDPDTFKLGSGWIQIYKHIIWPDTDNGFGKSPMVTLIKDIDKRVF